ncbi:ATP-binding protein [Paenibacillus larvae]|uniref:histidine kinase n=3 Tax=Paenibacillus larvae TaxID=1464 RepID=A0A2L1TW27_9BACL|nr:ATP-binding protein [Paenibacillus larvae]AQZ47528.1 PAS domain-containing sensor histidine kinase [Paenibacillus larvae subsp. pulvifaciens]AVF24886.1 sporulation kinase A [Paenibacillus larvae subsp. larvae]MBH0341252.1 histidine kinase [Paenibacillus larvae]MCY7521334.1 ATP-binding protein [Paenibacillus larvae]MCY9501734.1 ATP-binding protein [Paenibacillus larvae]
MTDIRQLYLQHLHQFVTGGSEDSMGYRSVLGPVLTAYLPEDLIAMHEECMLSIIRHADAEEALRMYHKSFLFLMELIAYCRIGSREAAAATDWRELLLQSEHSARTVKSKYENVLQHMDSGIALFDQDGYLTFANVKLGQFLGIPRRSILGYHFYHLIRHPDLGKSTKRLLYKLYKEMIVLGNPFQEVTNLRGRHLLVTAKFDDELDGDILISVKDVTEFKKIEQSAYYNDKLAMLGKIAAAIAHEIRNPLTSIRGFIQLLQPELSKLGKEDYGKIIIDEIDRANDIIYEFLNSSKPTKPVKQKILISSLLKEVVMLFESEALLRGCQIKITEADSDLWVRVDTKQLKQVFSNLVKNAVEILTASGEGRQGMIEIKAKKKEKQAFIQVRDNGPGMDEHTLSRLFDPFFTTKEEGTGLGLSVSYNIIKNHGGTIVAESEKGRGTVFNIELPLEGGMANCATGFLK